MKVEKQVGYLFSLILLGISIYYYLINKNFNFFYLYSILSVVLFFITIKFSNLLIPFSKLWIGLGVLMGKLISPIIMFIIFFFIVTPIGFILKIFGKDILDLKISNKTTFWVDRKNEIGKMKNQF